MGSQNISFQIPKAPRSIAKGSTLKDLLDKNAIRCLGRNLSLVSTRFDSREFNALALDGLEPLGILDRGHHLSHVLRQCLPEKYEKAIRLLLKTLTPPLQKTEDLGLGGFFYLPHLCFISNYGVDSRFNGGEDPFETSMNAQYELTKRFTAEFSIRYFLKAKEKRTLARLKKWVRDPDPHVRRLCSEGTRPRLPWAMRLQSFMENPKPVIPILEALKDDTNLYVRRSVANHLGDIAKDHPKQVFEICEKWLDGASPERKWLIRHALRYPSKKGDKTALRLRKSAK